MKKKIACIVADSLWEIVRENSQDGQRDIKSLRGASFFEILLFIRGSWGSRALNPQT